MNKTFISVQNPIKSTGDKKKNFLSSFSLFPSIILDHMRHFDDELSLFVFLAILKGVLLEKKWK